MQPAIITSAATGSSQTSFFNLAPILIRDSPSDDEYRNISKQPLIGQTAEVMTHEHIRFTCNIQNRLARTIQFPVHTPMEYIASRVSNQNPDMHHCMIYL